MVYLSNIPSAYKTELLRIAAIPGLDPVFVAPKEKTRHGDFFVGPGREEYQFLTQTSLDKRSVVQCLGSIMKMHKLFRGCTVVGGWDLAEYWFVRLCIRPKKLFMVLESSAHESATTGWRGALKRWFLRRVDGVIASGSPHIQLLMELRYGGRIIRSGGVGLHRWVGMEVSRPVWARNESLRLLFVGRLIPEKNLSMLIQLAQARPNIEITIVGDGTEQTALERGASGCPNLHFAGHVDNAHLPQYFERADVLVLPSRYEPWGLVVEEALHFGLPVIVSDVVGCAIDLVSKPGFGWVFESGSLTSLLSMVDRAEDVNEYQQVRLRVANRDNSKNVRTQVDALRQVAAMCGTL